MYLSISLIDILTLTLDWENREVTTDEGQQLADEYGFYFIETSCLTGENCQEVLNIAAMKILTEN